ncbi:MAG: tetratricopeptide repeat protein [Pseudomonadota bacterium]
MLSRLGPWLMASALLVTLSAGAAPNGPGPLRKDPKGLKGISQFQEAIKKGDDLFVARDFEGAVAAYTDATTHEPKNALGHYRLGEAQIAAGDLGGAEAAFLAGLRFAGADAPLKAKLTFSLADVHERQKAYDKAADRWSEYQALSMQHKEARGFAATALERKRALEAWKTASVEAAAVKARIEQRAQAADEAMRKSSK